MQTITLGQRWKMKDGGSEWRVVSLDVDTIGLSGPGPCRSMTYVEVDDFFREWSLVVEDERRVASGDADSASARRWQR